MTSNPPAAYCYFQSFKPRPPLDAVFDKDYLLHAVSGALRLTVERESWLLPRSFAAWIPAGTPILVGISKPLTTCSVLVRPGFCVMMPKTPTVFQMSPMTRHMIQHCKDWNSDAPHPPEAEGFFLSLLNVCAGLVAKSVDVKRPFATDPTLQSAIEITEARICSAVTAGEIARETGLSERSMQRRFAEDVGMTWAEVLTRLRMIHALQLLGDMQMPIIEIAGECGFNSLSAFNRAFLKFAQCTPSEFRKTIGG